MDKLISKPIISIVVAINDMEETLQRCIDSIYTNVNLDFEFILIDGNSTDNSQKICLEYRNKYKNITYIKLSSNDINDVYNVGLKYSKCKYLYFIKGCDILCENFIKDGVEFLEKNNINVFVRNCKILCNNSIDIYDNYFTQTKFGPFLSMCIFKKSSIKTTFNDYICTEIIFSGKNVWLNNSFYFDKENHNSFIMNMNYNWKCYDYIKQFGLKWETYALEKIQEFIEYEKQI